MCLYDILKLPKTLSNTTEFRKTVFSQKKDDFLAKKYLKRKSGRAKWVSFK